MYSLAFFQDIYTIVFPMGEYSETSTFFKNRQENKWILVFESSLTGLITGLVITGFKLSISHLRHFRFGIYDLIREHGIGMFLLAIAVLAAAGLFIGFIITKRPMIRGGGVAQIEGVFMQKLQFSPLPELPLKFIGGVLGIGLGLSIGREGPSVQLGAYVGDTLEKIGKRSFTERVCLITAGAAAGLSATFNAPFAAIIFALEDIHQHLSPLLLACVMAGSFAGDFTAGTLLGHGPIFRFSGEAVYPISQFIWLIGLGVFVTLVGHGFKQSIYFFQHLYQKLHIPPLLCPTIPFLISLPIGLWYGYAGGGGDALMKALTEQPFSVHALLIILIVKILFTGISAGSGAIGGIFVPLLACGAVSGTIYAKLLVHFGLLEQEQVTNMLLFGMAACFTAVIKAPLTACAIVFEISGAFHLLSGLVLTCLTVYLTATFIGSQAHDHILLTQILESQRNSSKEKHRKEKYCPQLYERPVCLQSFAALKKIGEIEWPDKCLIVGVIHGEDESIPDGNTLLYPGDKLIILAEENGAEPILEKITALTCPKSKSTYPDATHQKILSP